MMRKRLCLTFLIWSLAVLHAGPAIAHRQSLRAFLTVDGTNVTIRLADPYDVPVPQAKVGIALRMQDKRGKVSTLVENNPGTYRGTMSEKLGQADSLDLTIESAAELFEASVPVDLAERSADREIPLAPIDFIPRYDWTPILYAAAVVVLVTVTGYAWLRRRQVAAEADDDEIE